MHSGNLFEQIVWPFEEESVSTLTSGREVRIQRIVSRGQSSPADFWYDQDEAEYVLLISGSAILEFEDSRRTLRPGDWIDIPAHMRHRVAWTAPDVETVWLTVFYR